MTPPANSKPERPLDFYHWLAARGMNPNRRRPLGRVAALFMDYRAYLERQVGRENVSTWLEKYGKKVEEVLAQSRKND